MEYQAPQGENWQMVSKRAYKFLNDKCLDDGLYLCVTHGGLICALTYPLGIIDVLPNSSIAGISITGDNTEVDFTWTCPEILHK